MYNKIILIGLLIVFSFIQLQCNKESAEAYSGNTTGTGGSMARFTIVGNYLYTVDKADLKVFSIVDPTNPILRNTVPVGFEIETIYPFKNRLFIGSTSVVHIFSIDNPESPQKLSVAISPNVIRRCDPVIARDSVAYATLRSSGICGGTQSILATYDIRDINNPIQRNFLPIQEPYGLGFMDTTLYVCKQNGLDVYGIGNPYNPNYRSTMQNNEWFFDVIPYNNSLVCWVKGGLIIMNISNRNNPIFVKKII